jgi:hypothetical protein
MNSINDYLKIYDPETYNLYKYDLVINELKIKIEELNVKNIIYQNTGCIIYYIKPNIFNKIQLRW